MLSGDERVRIFKDNWTLKLSTISYHDYVLDGAMQLDTKLLSETPTAASEIMDFSKSIQSTV